ncbi:MAG TPA: hypothetical protein VMZ26_17270 [Pyrinomonadaceae bacterium]|nr:hypothetical protein [Pyrinomonadaceae bacterium]
MKNFTSGAVRSLAFLGVVTFLMLAIALVPGVFYSGAENEAASPPVEAINNTARGFPNFDIRTEKGDGAEDRLASFRSAVGKDSSFVAAIRNDLARGEESLRSRQPDVVLEHNDRLGSAEVISPDVWKDGSELLTPPSNEARPQSLRNFLKQNAGLVGLDHSQTDSLKVAADYTNPDGNLSFTHLEQQVNGVPVFAGEVKAGFNKNGQIVRVVNNLAPALDYTSLSKNFGNPADAVRAAAGYIDHELAESDLQTNAKSSSNLKVVFGQGDWATTAEKMYFPTEPGVAVPSWRVLIWEPVDAYYVIVDAATGTMLWRKNITNDQTQTATYNVYRNRFPILMWPTVRPRARPGRRALTERRPR